MYQGNPSLRKAGEILEYDPWMIEENIKCSQDIVYFAENYFTIVTIDHGKHLIKLHDFQKKMLKAFVETPDNKKNLIVKTARQSGKCLHKHTMMKFRNKKTGEIMEMTAEEFYNLNKNKLTE